MIELKYLQFGGIGPIQHFIPLNVYYNQYKKNVKTVTSFMY